MGRAALKKIAHIGRFFIARPRHTVYAIYYQQREPEGRDMAYISKGFAPQSRMIREGGKVVASYDTGKAELIGTANNLDRHTNANDFSAWEAGLYRQGDRYFLAGIGGPRSPYAHRCEDGGRNEGYKIIPLHHDEAQYWARIHLDMDLAEAEAEATA